MIKHPYDTIPQQLDRATLPVSQVLLIDPQTRFLKTIPDADLLVQRWNHYLVTFAALNLPVLTTRQVPQKLGDIDNRISLPSPASVLDKTTFSCLANTEIKDHLLKQNRRYLLIMGIETAICVYQTCLDALAHNFHVTILNDAIGGRRPADSSLALEHMTAAGAHRIAYDMLVYQLIQDTRSRYFNTLLPLIKSYPQTFTEGGARIASLND